MAGLALHALEGDAGPHRAAVLCVAVETLEVPPGVMLCEACELHRLIRGWVVARDALMPASAALVAGKTVVLPSLVRRMELGVRMLVCGQRILTSRADVTLVADLAAHFLNALARAEQSTGRLVVQMAVKAVEGRARLVAAEATKQGPQGLSWVMARPALLRG